MPGLAHWDAALTARWLRAPGPSDDKYRRGVLGVRTGSADYPGAAVLGVTAAWRAGIGLLRYVPPADDAAEGDSAEGGHPEGGHPAGAGTECAGSAGARAARFGLPSPAAAVLAARPETVFGEPQGRPCDAWLVGSGTDPETRSPADTAALMTLLRGEAPVVVDAGALGLVAAAAGEGSLPPVLRAPTIVTPHRGEFERLWQACGLGDPPTGWPDRRSEAEAELAPLAEGASRLAQRLGAAVLLKGSTTVAAAPAGPAFAIGPATPWLAAAGTGDVLAGALGALVACHADAVRQDPSLLRDLGAAAAQLHDTAARIASGEGSGRPVTALDVADAMPAAFERLAS